MSTVLYRMKVLSSKQTMMSSDALYELHTDSSLKNLRSYLKDYGYDAGDEPKVVRFQRFKEILKEHAPSPEAFFEPLAAFPDINRETVEEMSAGYGTVKPGCCKTFVFSQLAAELFPQFFSMHSVTEVVAEAASYDPDVGFPRKRTNAKVLLNDWKRFALRLLVDIHREVFGDTQHDAISGFYEQNGGDLYAETPESCNEIVWGVELLDAIKVTSTGKAALKKYADRWWLKEARDRCLGGNDYVEYQKFRVVLPVGWFPEMDNRSGVIDSRAFW